MIEEKFHFSGIGDGLLFSKFFSMQKRMIESQKSNSSRLETFFSAEILTRDEIILSLEDK
jgi:hypothetical protein